MKLNIRLKACVYRQYLYTVNLTFVAVVRCIQISLELVRAAVRRGSNDILEALVRYRKFTRPSSGALAVQVANHVYSTADIAVICAHATSDRHASVHRLSHNDYLTLGTHWSELLGVADLTRIYNTETINQPNNLYNICTASAVHCASDKKQRNNKQYSS